MNPTKLCANLMLQLGGYLNIIFVISTEIYIIALNVFIDKVQEI